MPTRIMYGLLVVVLTALAACGQAQGPKPQDKVIATDSAEARQLDQLLTEDPGLQQLQKAGYSPVAVLANKRFRIVTYHVCGTMPVQECSTDNRPNASQPVVALFTDKVALNDPISFSGDFRLIYKEPDNLEPLPGIKPDDYKLYCRLKPPRQAPPALPVEYIRRFAEVGNHFSALDYSVQKDKTMTHTLPSGDGSLWECTASTQLV